MLELKNITISFAGAQGTQKVVRGVSLTVHKGEILALVGESGSGKSLTALAAIGLLPLAATLEGSVTVDAISLVNCKKKELRRMRGEKVAIILQEPMSAMNPLIRIGKQVKEAVALRKDLQSKKQVREKVDALFREVELHDARHLYNAYPHELSGGQLQRVMIAIALARDPEYLIADEPTSSLDATIQKQIIDLIVSIQKKRGMGILLISHDISLVSSISDRIIFMYKGEFVESGGTYAVFSDAKHWYSKSLIANYKKRFERKTRNLTVESNDEKEHDNSIVLINNIKVVYTKGFLRKKRYVALNGVTMDVKSGYITALAGESGSGKSTIAKAIIGIAPINSGMISLFGKDTQQIQEEEKKGVYRKCQMIFQNSSNAINPRLKVEDTLSEPYLLQGERNKKIISEKVIRLLTEVNLDKVIAQRFPHELSGGQRQRVNIARALAMDPSLLICDEAVSALDVNIQQKLVQLLLSIQEQRKITILFISHDLRLIKEISDYLYVIEKGSIVEIGMTKNIFSAPQMNYTKKLMQCYPKLNM